MDLFISVNGSALSIDWDFGETREAGGAGLQSNIDPALIKMLREAKQRFSVRCQIVES